MSDKMNRVHILISGRVQGVGFRFFARHCALKLNISGYAKNLVNGDVEIIAEGKKSNLDEFVKELKKGPPLSRVADVKINKREYTDGFRRFSIRY